MATLRKKIPYMTAIGKHLVVTCLHIGYRMVRLGGYIQQIKRKHKIKENVNSNRAAGLYTAWGSGRSLHCY